MNNIPTDNSLTQPDPEWHIKFRKDVLDYVDMLENETPEQRQERRNANSFNNFWKLD